MRGRGNLLLNGRYRLADQLAAGGMGEVWKGVDELLGRQVAVKLLHHQYANDPTFRARFRAEARYTAQLTHPGIAQVYDYGEQEDLSFLIMELVPGQPLSEILARHRRLTGDVTLDIVGQTARALQTAHVVGLMHRDIKPGNLLVTPDGVVKVTDFGIARAAEAVTLTQTGTVMGTAHYVSPEQAAGKELTPATDIYSLGVVAYECLAGRLPFTAETVVTVALKHVRESPPPLPDDVPEPVQELVALALEKDPAARPRTAGELADRAHVVRETIALGAPRDTGDSTLPNLLAAPGESPADAEGTQPLAGTPDVPPEAAATAAGSGQPPHDAVDHDGAYGSDPYDDAASARSRRARRGPVLALTAVVVLASALLAGALWRADDAGREQARHTQATDTPSPAVVVPPAVSDAPSPQPTQTSEEPSQRRLPGGNISPQPTGGDDPDTSPPRRPSDPGSPSPTPSGGTSDEGRPDPSDDPQGT